MTYKFKKIGLIFLGFFIAVLLSEFFLRVLGFPASSIYRIDQNTGLLTFRPNEKIYIRSECFSNVVKTNSLGFHSKEYNLARPDDVFRIVIIGDSFIEASQVPIEKTFAHLLEEKLNNQANSKYRYEVIPFGISSHGTYKSLLYLKAYALDFEPDLIIAAYTLNDLEDDAMEEIKFNERSRPILEIAPVGPKSVVQRAESFFKSILRKSVLVTTLRKKILSLKSNLEGKTIAEPFVDNVELVAKAWVIQEKLFSSFNEISRANNSKFLLLSLADARVHSDSAIDTVESEKLKSIAEKNNFPYFDLMPIFKERAEKEGKVTVWPCDGHWNETGNEWAADALFKYLYENLLLNQ